MCINDVIEAMLQYFKFDGEILENNWQVQKIWTTNSDCFTRICPTDS